MHEVDNNSGTIEISDEAMINFLEDHDNLIRMKTASKLRRPALEPLSEYIVQKFGQSSKSDYNKQKFGKNTRKVMERHGYRLEQNGVRITSKGNIFSSASRYVPKT